MPTDELVFLAGLVFVIGFLMLGATCHAYEAGKSESERGYNIFLSVSNLAILALILFVLA